MTGGELEKALARADAKSAPLLDAVIVAGYGRSTMQDMRAMKPMPAIVAKYLAAFDVEASLRHEIQRRRTYSGTLKRTPRA